MICLIASTAWMSMFGAPASVSVASRLRPIGTHWMATRATTMRATMRVTAGLVAVAAGLGAAAAGLGAAAAAAAVVVAEPALPVDPGPIARPSTPQRTM